MMEMLKCWDFRPDWRMGVSLRERDEGVALKRQIYYKAKERRKIVTPQPQLLVHCA